MRRILPILVLFLFAALGCSDKPRTELKNPTAPPPVDSNVPSTVTLPQPPGGNAQNPGK